jgi:hypothetical protein
MSFNEHDLQFSLQLYMDSDREATMALKLSCANYCFIAYTVPNDSAPIVTDPSSPMPENMRVTLSTKLKHFFKEMEVQSKYAQQALILLL